jgi:hypothetical protein
MLNGKAVPGAKGTTFSVPTIVSGQNTVSLRVSAGGQTKMSDTVSFRIKDYRLPTIRLSVAQSTITAGATDTLSATATGSECGDPVRIQYSASEGSINGATYDSSGVSFDHGLQTKVIHLTATATDRTGGLSTASADLTVTSKRE